MRVDTDRSRNEYRNYHRKKYDERIKRRNYRNNDHHYHSRNNINHTSRSSLKSPYYHNDNYSSNRIHNNHLNNYDNYTSTSTSSRLDRQTNNRDVYSSLITNQTMLSRSSSPAVSYYNSSQSIRDRNISSHYIDSERNRYPQSSSTYRRNSPTSSTSYRNNDNDSYIRDEYQSSTSPLCIRNTTDSYDDIYRTNEYNNRSERYDIPQNRNDSSRDYSLPVYHSDTYRTSTVIPMSSHSSLSSSYTTRDQYIPGISSSIREIDYRTKDYEMTRSNDNRYHDDYNSSSSYHKRSRSNFNENESNKFMRR